MEIYEGPEKIPFRILVYGVPGIGKTTFASHAPSALIVQLEKGAHRLNCAKTSHVKSFEEFLRFLWEVKDNDKYETIVLDSLDALERLATLKICKEEGVAKISDVPYGRGWAMVGDLMNNVLEKLDVIQECGKNIILIAHSKLEKVSSPTEGEFSRYNIEMGGQSAKTSFQKWSDMIIFCNWKEIEDGNRSVRMRCGFTEETRSYMAKDRYGVPAMFPLNGVEFFTNLNKLIEGETNE